jgi:Tol biopolymer transport system component
MRAQPKAPSAIVANVPSDLEKVIVRCLRKDPDRRFQHIGDVKVALQEIKEESDSGSLSIPVAAPPRLRRARLVTAAAVVTIIGAAAWLLLSHTAFRSPPPADSDHRAGASQLDPVPFTTLPGEEVAPTFSPDGSQIAFGWSPEGSNAQFDLYVKVTGNETPLRLTKHAADFVFPAWSPDGRQIAVARMGEESGIYLVSPLGGAERKLVNTYFEFFLETMLSWSADGKVLAFYEARPNGHHGISLLDVATLNIQPLNGPGADCAMSWVPAFSPDGRSLAMACLVSFGVNDLFVMPAGGGSGRRLVRVHGDFTGMGWRPGGDLIYAVNGDLWRIASSGGQPEKLMAGGNAGMPAISRNGRRLAYTTQSVYNINLWQVEMAGPSRTVGPPVKLVSSSKSQTEPAFSPDGRRLAFSSDRSGTDEVWTSDADGSNPVALTALGGPNTTTPTWSPDGQFIAFDSRAEGRSRIYVVPSAGGPLRRVITGIEDSSVPDWSTDGRWLFFCGDSHVLKVPVEGGTAVPLTRGRVWPPVARVQDARVYYAKDGGICSVTLAGADERCLAGFPRMRSDFGEAWVIGRSGVYFTNPGPPRPGVDYFEFGSTGVVRVTDLTGQPASWKGRLALSPDGRRLVYPQLDAVASDIMVVDDFH